MCRCFTVIVFANSFLYRSRMASKFLVSLDPVPVVIPADLVVFSLEHRNVDLPVVDLLEFSHTSIGLQRHCSLSILFARIFDQTVLGIEESAQHIDCLP
ncbi:hypothetical protein Tco_1447936 [Tanacetum coccineum]